ncbi:MAG: hypothetical protein L0J75_01390 [Alkalibacterium sp.]|nr:hypothetical protein [Alkalibacterium sp.]
MQSFEEVDYLLVNEYLMLMKAKALEKLDRERDIYLQAFVNDKATATETRGKKTYTKYPSFEKFFDYEKHRDDLLGIKKEKNKKQRDIKQLVLLANKRGG